MKAPANRLEISESWLEFMLSDYINRQTPGAKVSIVSFTVSNATKPGDGYSGDLCVLNLQASIIYRNSGNEPNENIDPVVTDYSFIIKLANPNPIMSHMQTILGINMREFMIYSEVIHELNKFQKEKTDNQFPIDTPGYIYGKCSGDEFVLVMENMKLLDYVTIPDKGRMNLQQTKKVLEQQARLHAVSYTYDKMHNFLDKYPCFKLGRFKDLMSIGASTGLDVAMEYLDSISDKEFLVKKIKAAKPKVVKTIKDIFEEETSPRIMCLMHGDSWYNNIMFRQKDDENGNESVSNSDELVLIDWQISHWNTSVEDLHYFIYSSTTPAFRRAHLNEVLEHYHTIFTDATIKLGTPVPYWTFEQFKKEFDRLIVFGFFKGLQFAQLGSDSAKEFKFGEVSSSVPNPVISSIKKGIAKIVVPLIMKPSIMEAGMKKMMKPMVDELLSGKTPHFSNLYLELLLEAEENGIFDVELPSSNENGNKSRSLKCI